MVDSVIISLLLILLTLSTFAVAQNPKSSQWQQAGGEMILPVAHEFSTTWTSDGASREKGLYWSGGFYDPVEKRKYASWDKTVINSVAPKLGEITVQGPGVVALFERTSGDASIYMRDQKTNATFYPFRNTLRMTKANKRNGSVRDFSRGESWGRIKTDEVVTIDVGAAMSAYDNMMNTGEYSFLAPQKVLEAEVWFFPEAGGKVIEAIKICSNGEKIDITNGDKPCKGEKPSKETVRITQVIGDEIEVDIDGNGNFVEAEEGMLLTNKSIIVTGMDSSIVIDFAKRGKVRVGEMTDFSVDEYIITTNGMTADTSLKVGDVDVEVDRRFKEVDFSVSTSTCVSSVRGTKFHISYKKLPSETTVCVSEGEVKITPILFSAKPKNLYAGECITVDNHTFKDLTAECLHNNSSLTDPDITPLPFFEDFSHGASKWILPTGVLVKNGHIVWNTGNFNGIKLKNPIPMEDIVIEFDGYAETNGINVWLQNNDSKGYTTIFGGWNNTQSGSDIGANEENRQLIAGKVWTPKKWQHYKIVKSGDTLAAYCDGRLIFKRVSPKYFEGYGYLKFDSWNAVIGIDNVRIYRATKNQDPAGKKPGVSSAGNNFGKINPNAKITITTFHTSPKGVNNIAYTSIMVKDENNKIYIQDPYKTNNNPASKSKKPIPNNHFGVYPTEKTSYTVQDLIDAGPSRSTKNIHTRYSTILMGTQATVIGEKLKVALYVKLNHFPAGKKYIYARTVDLQSVDSGWQKVGEFNIVASSKNSTTKNH